MDNGPKFVEVQLGPDPNIPYEQQMIIPLDVAAKRCGCSTKWLREAMKKGELRHVKEPHGELYYYLTSIEALIEWQNRDKKKPGRGEDRAHYDVSGSTNDTFEIELIELCIRHGFTLKRHNKFLVGGPDESRNDSG